MPSKWKSRNKHLPVPKQGLQYSTQTSQSDDAVEHALQPSQSSTLSRFLCPQYTWPSHKGQLNIWTDELIQVRWELGNLESTDQWETAFSLARKQSGRSITSSNSQGWECLTRHVGKTSGWPCTPLKKMAFTASAFKVCVQTLGDF